MLPLKSQTKPISITMPAKKTSRLYIKYSSFVFLLTAANLIHRGNFVELNDDNPIKTTLRSNRLREPEFCPLEHFLNLTSGKGGNETAYKIGDSMKVHCHLNKHVRRMIGDNFEVYPRRPRECLPGGIWSGPRPICALKIGMAVHETQSLASPSGSHTCFDSSKRDYDKCPDYRNNIGNLHQQLTPERTVTKGSSVETFGCVFNFGVSYFLNAAILRIAKDIGDLMNVTVMVNDEDRIKDISDEARNFQYRDFEIWYEQHTVDQGFQEYPVVNLSAYTKNVVVHYSIVRTHTKPQQMRHQSADGCGPAGFQFYRILEAKYLDGVTTERHSDVIPIIPNAHVSYSSNDSSIVRFQCKKGYVLTRAGTDELFNEEIKFEEEGWKPYPLPVCRAVIAEEEHEKSSKNSAERRDEKIIEDEGLTIEDLERRLKTLEGSGYSQTTLLVTWVYILSSALGIFIVLATTFYVCCHKMKSRQDRRFILL